MLRSPFFGHDDARQDGYSIGFVLFLFAIRANWLHIRIAVRLYFWSLLLESERSGCGCVSGSNGRLNVAVDWL